ncbi:MAG: DMT family transporter [Ruminococcaceae bacterium]|nr:DMT family transporter [Oscillospiraceae bacterium]
MKNRIISLIMLLLTAMIWGFAFVAQVAGTNYIGSLTMCGARFLLATVALVPVILIFEKGRSTPQQRKDTVFASLITGVILFLASIFQQYGIQYTQSAGISGFITGLYTVFIPIVCFVLFKQKTGINVIIGAICAIFGLFLLCYRPGDGFHFGLGELLLLIGAFFWTAHVIVIDRLGKKARPLRFSMGQFAVCAVLGIIGALIFEESSMGALLDAKWAILYCGIMSSGVAYTLQIMAQRRCDPTMAAIVFSSESMFSAIGGVIFRIDSIALIGYVGCAFMLAGIVLSQIKFGKRTRTEEPLQAKEK